MSKSKAEKEKEKVVIPRTRGKRGPQAERVKIDGNWEEAMKKALKAPPQRKQK